MQTLKFYSLEQCKKIGERFRQIRKELGITAEQVAEQVGITVWCYRLIEEGIEEKLEVQIAEKIAMRLGILKTKILPQSQTTIFDAAVMNPKDVKPIIQGMKKAMTKKKRKKSGVSKETMLSEGQMIMTRRKELGLSRKKLEQLAGLPTNSLPPIELRGECLWPEREKHIHKVLDVYRDENNLPPANVEDLQKDIKDFHDKKIKEATQRNREQNKSNKELSTIAHAMMAGILMRDCGLTKEKALEVAKVMTELFVFMDQLVPKC